MSTPAPDLGLDLTVLVFEEVFHVGTLNPADRRTDSYEGEGLSVSMHPDEWAAIARLVGTTWRLARPDGALLRFASFHDLTEQDRHRLRNWGAARGWVEQRTAYRVSWFDDEWNTTMSVDLAGEDQAHAEAEEVEGTVAPVVVWRATEAFPDGRVHGGVDPTDLLLVAYVRACRPDLDGVWWADRWDPARLSCPRGVLTGAVSGYRVSPVSR